MQEFTNKVITLWYRPPEILLGATKYGPQVDVWSAGCILAELLLGKPLFTGKTEMDQLHLIFELLGTPTPQTWDGLNDLKLLRTGQVTLPTEEQHRKIPKLRAKYSKKMPAPAMNLLEKLLELDPYKRLTADRALTSRYFLSEPIAPENPEELGSIEVMDMHEFQTKKKRRQAKAEAEKAKEAAKAAGMDDDQAQEQFDACYRKLMKKVAAEGLDAFGSSSVKRKERKEKERSSPVKEEKVELISLEKRESKRKDKDLERGEPDRHLRERGEPDRPLREREDDDTSTNRRDRESEKESRRKRRREEEHYNSERRHKESRNKDVDDEGEEPKLHRKESKRSRDKSSRSSRDRDRDRDKDRSERVREHRSDRDRSDKERKEHHRSR